MNFLNENENENELLHTLFYSVYLIFYQILKICLNSKH